MIRRLLRWVRYGRRADRLEKLDNYSELAAGWNECLDEIRSPL